MPAPSSPSCGNVRSRFSNRADVTALLAAFCFFLSAIEYMLPKPLPFMRLGIANLPILLAVDMLPFNWFLVLAAAKVVGMSIVSGTLFSYVALFSLAGTMVAALVMRGVRRTGGHAVSLVGVSVAGAVTSNAMQMLIARYVIFGEVAWLIAPLFLVTGLITGTLMGIFAEFFVEHSGWYSCAMGESDDLAFGFEDEEGGSGESGASGDSAAAESKDSASARVQGASGNAADFSSQNEKKLKPDRGARKSQRNERRFERRHRYEDMFEPWVGALLGAGIAIFFLLQRDIVAKVLYLAVFILWTWFAGKRFSLISTLVVSAGIVAANLLIPSGRVLAKIGPLAITQFALTEGLSKALTFEGLIYLSKAAIMPGLRFPGRFGSIIAQAFQYYDRIIEYRGKVHAKTVISDIDRLLQVVWTSARISGEAEASAASKGAQAGPAHRSRVHRSLILAAGIAAAVVIIPFAAKLIAS